MCHHEIGYCRVKEARRAFLKALRADDAEKLTSFAVSHASNLTVPGNVAPECKAELRRICDAANAHANFIEARDYAKLLKDDSFGHLHNVLDPQGADLARLEAANGGA
jgi:hypothetical protein